MRWFFLQFSERITGSYPEVFDGGTAEGQSASEYFSDFGWYPTIKKLAKNDILRIPKVEKLGLHHCLMFLACQMVENKVKAAIRKGNYNTLTTHL